MAREGVVIDGSDEWYRLAIASEVGHLLQAASVGDLNTMRYLLECGRSINAKGSFGGRIVRGNGSLDMDLLWYLQGLTAAIVAAKEGQPKSLEYAVSRGADLSATHGLVREGVPGGGD